nr:pentatricopeptide repeat-containing protein [Tanacetum cinerariifolium]
IGNDENNHIYPVAWAVVNYKNKDNWTWFLELLEEDLGCNKGNGLTLMSDQHEVRSGSEGFTVDEGKRTCSCKMWQLSGLPCVHATKEPVVEQTPKPKGVVGRPRKKQPVDDFEEVDVVQRGPVRDEGRGTGGSGGASGSRGRGATGSRGGASGSIGKGVGGSKRKPVSTAGTQKRQGKKMVGTFGFTKWFGLQDETEQTQAAPQKTQHEPEQTQVEDQVKQTEDQAQINLTQLEQTQEPTQDQVQEPTQQPTQEPQEQPQQAALRMSSARILKRKLGKKRQ